MWEDAGGASDRTAIENERSAPCRVTLGDWIMSGGDWCGHRSSNLRSGRDRDLSFLIAPTLRRFGGQNPDGSETALDEMVAREVP